jgi:hypothetical protein
MTDTAPPQPPDDQVDPSLWWALDDTTPSPAEPAAQPGSGEAPDVAQHRAGAVLTLTGGALVVLALFLPWATATSSAEGSVTMGGLDIPDATFFLVTGIVITGMGGVRMYSASPAPRWITAATSIAVIVVASTDASRSLSYISSMHTAYPWLGGSMGPCAATLVVAATAALVGACIPLASNTAPNTDLT